MSQKNESIEDKMVKLRQLVEWFESDDFSLTEATDMFEKANKLAREVEHDLSEMKNKVTTLKESFENA